MIREEKIKIRLGNTTKFEHIGKTRKDGNLREYRFIEALESNREMAKILAECVSKRIPEARNFKVLIIILEIDIDRMDLCNTKAEIQLLDTSQIVMVDNEEYFKYFSMKAIIYPDDVLRLLELVEDEELKKRIQ